MEFLQDLRQNLFDLRKRLFPPKRQRRKPPTNQGLPDSLPRETIEALYQAYYGGTPQSYCHQHLSGWKSSGAYRICASMGDGRTAYLIYKVATYYPEDIQALVGLPVQPGPAEFAILSRSGGSLAPYLPRVFMAEETEPGRLYRYIMEDVAQDHHRVIGEKNIRKAAELFPAFHDAMHGWEPREGDGLIHYGQAFSEALQTYALPRLEQYVRQHDDPAVRELVDNWSAISRMHMAPEFFEFGPRGLIHGDPNYSNVYLHVGDARKMKLVDWEWAGYGTPFADLVSLLKGAPARLERLAVGHMAAHLNIPSADARRLYAWCTLERGMLDAAFLSVQALTTEHQTRFSLHTAVTSSAGRAVRAFRQLS